MAGLFDLMDCMVADELGVDVEVYIKIIEQDCTHWESTFIILAMLEEDNPNRKEKARKLFNSYVKD
jgi:hypothetical protein